MKYLTIDHIRQALRLDPYTGEDAYLDLIGGAAEDAVLNLCRRSIDNVIETWGCVPDGLRLATLLLVGNAYRNREASGPGSQISVPYGFDINVKPYMRLAGGDDDAAAGTSASVRCVALGSDVKIVFSTELPDGLSMEDVPFTVEVYNETAVGKSLTFDKADCLPADDGSYIVLVPTEGLGAGLVKLRITYRIPDTDFPAGYRTQVERVNPHIRITG